MKRLGQVGAWCLVVGLTGLPRDAHAVWEFTAPVNPSRSWSVNLSTGVGYDDNVNTSPNNKQSALTGLIEPQLLVNFPMERTQLGLRYNYQARYYSRRDGSKIAESHVADMGFSWRASPRLSMSISDSVRRGLEPGLVEQQGGVPIIVRQRGDYLYNSLGGRVSYALTRRWTASVDAGWTHWSYDVAALASNNDQNVYSTLLSAVYSLNPRTFVGGNYRYSTVQYTNPGPSDSRNSEAHTAYLSLVRQFNPRLSAQLNSGLELREFGDGTQQVAPSIFGSMSYNYGPERSLSASVAYYLSTTEVGFFRSTDTTSFSLQALHRFTPRLSASASGAYVLNTFQNPAPGFAFLAGLEEEAFTINLGLKYRWRDWIESGLSYSYNNVTSQLGDRSFDRNQIGVNLRLSY